MEETEKTLDPWELRYRRALLEFINARSGHWNIDIDSVDLALVRVETDYYGGYHYSAYTYENPSVEMHVDWIEPAKPAEGFAKARDRRECHAWLDMPEIADFLRSLTSPTS